MILHSLAVIVELVSLEKLFAVTLKLSAVIVELLWLEKSFPAVTLKLFTVRSASLTK